VADSVGADRADFGVLFVGGFASQRRGDAVAAFSAALYRWLYRWNGRHEDDGGRPAARNPLLADAVLSAAQSDGQGGPAHLTLSAGWSWGEAKDAKWLISESCWASIFDVPDFLGMARWIWKVSTCLLVLQFVIPMRRNWRQAAPALRRILGGEHRRDDSPDATRGRGNLVSALADAGSVAWYALLMAAAAALSVLLSLVLLALAVADKLPIPRIDGAVRWVVVRLSCILGDSYMLAHCPVQFAAMQTQVAQDLDWLLRHCNRVAIVAHSQGAAVAHQVLADAQLPLDMGTGGKLCAFITLGQGISKFLLLKEMDWDSDKQGKVRASRALVTAGMACAGLPALAQLASRWSGAPVLAALTAWPWTPGLFAAGIACITAGTWTALRAFGSNLAAGLRLPLCSRIPWTDYYTSADPVSIGPVQAAPGDSTSTATGPESGLPETRPPVYANASMLNDHVSYLRNQDQLLPSVLNDLLAIAYGDPVTLVSGHDLERARKSRLTLNRMLIAARLAVVGLAVSLWQLNPGSIGANALNGALRLVDPGASMTAGQARPAAVILMAIAVYCLVILTWRSASARLTRRFFRTATRRPGTTAGALQPTAEPASDQSSAAISAASI
jgi:hypothetical protein